MSIPTVDQVVAKYIETRDEIARRQKELEAELKPLKEFQKRREAWLNEQLVAAGADNIKTPHGTAYRFKTESVSVEDWDALFRFIATSKQYNLFTRAVNKTAVLELMGEDRSQAVPPGVKYVAMREVGVRKS